MSSTSKTVVFFGSGPVASRALALLSKHCQVEAVITKSVTKRQMSEVAGSAPVFVADSREALAKLLQERSFQSTVGVLIDFGIIVDRAILDCFPLGIVNSHFSLLPEWRGADPITFAVLSGQERTGVSLMLLVEKMDEGPLLAQSPLDIPAKATTPELTEGLVELSDRMLEKILPLYFEGQIEAASQEAVTMAESTEPTYSRKLTKDDGVINWEKPAAQLEREIRAYLGWPGSRTELFGKDVIITEAEVANEQGSPGSVDATKKELIVYCGQEALRIKKLKPAGKKEMNVQAFLAGYRK